MPIDPIKPEKLELFLEILSKIWVPARACELAEISMSSIQREKKNNEEFAAKFKDAQNLAKDRLVDKLRTRAVEGIDKPIFYKGKVVSILKEFDSKVGMWLAESWDKGTYGRQKSSVELTGAEGKPLIPEQTGDIEVARRIAFMLHMAERAVDKKEPVIIDQTEESNDPSGDNGGGAGSTSAPANGEST